MSSKPPGVSGTFTNPASPHDRALTGNGSFRSPAPAGHTGPPSFQDVERHLTQLAHRFSTAIGWNDKRSTAFKLLGEHSFTAGVVWGIGENFARTVFSAVELVEMLALAEYWESKHNHTLMGQVRANMFMTAVPGVSFSMFTMGYFWPGFDQKAKEAYEERDALIDAIKYAFSHPKDLLGSLTKAQEARYKEFMVFLGEKSLSGNFHAGKLMGELLFDLFMVIDLVAGLAKLVAALPNLARYAEDFAKLAREFRAARQLETKAADLAEPGPRMTQAEKDAAQARMRPSSDRPAPPPPPPDPPPPPIPPKTPVTQEEASQKIGNVEGAGGADALSDVAARRAYLNDKFGRTGDLNLDINIRGRQEIATNFFRSQGIADDSISSYLTGYDFTQPVEVRSVGAGKTLWQYQTAGAPQGNWYTFDPGTLPTELGINPSGFNRATQTVEPKLLNMYTTTDSFDVLWGKSAAVNDFWSVKGQPFMTTGGGTQMFTNNKSSIVFVPN